MKKRIGIVLFTALFLLLAAAVFAVQQQEVRTVPLYVEITANGHTETISCGPDGNGQNYFFLPSYANAEDLILRTATAQEMYVDGKPVLDGMPLADVEWNTPYALQYRRWGRTKQETLLFMRSANVAAMYVDTASGSMAYIHSEKGVKETAVMRLYDEHGQAVCAGNLESIGGRGNFTWDNYEKKPYSISLSHSADLLGMGAAQRWILLANAFDPSHLRNRMVYDFAAEIGMAYSPQSQWVDLYLNGGYAGLYLLSERNEVHEQRVDIDPENSFLVSAEPVDRLIKQNYPYLQTKAGVALRVHHPQQASSDQLTALLRDWQHIENAILAEDGIDPETGLGWQEWIDVDSWVSKYLIEEIFGSGDACFLSQFYYRDVENGLVYAGPVWDFDRSMGSKDIWEFEMGQVFVADRLEVKDGYNAPWFYALNQKPEFAQRVRELYQQQFLPLLQEYFANRLDAYADSIEQAAYLNQLRWNGKVDLRTEVRDIRRYMTDRIDFLSSVWIDEKEYCRVRADHGFGGFYAYYAIEPGQCLGELPVFEDTETMRFLGWYSVESGEPVDLTMPVQEDFQIIARWQEISAKKADQLLKLAPLGVIGLMGAGLLLAEIKRGARGRGKKHG